MSRATKVYECVNKVKNKGDTKVAPVLKIRIQLFIALWIYVLNCH